MSSSAFKIVCEAKDDAERQAIERLELIEFGKQYGLMGESPTFLSFLKKLRGFASFSRIVLLEGETGTGKELAAQALHGNRIGPFLPVNCGSLMGEMAGAAFTGHKKNSFTDSSRTDRNGLFVGARDGTLFLDEIHLLSNATQQLLLRVLQTKRILPIGETIEADVSSVRVVAASNKNLEAMVKDGELREDLYYRINVLRVHVPALRERAEDIRMLAQHFVKKHCEEFNSPVDRISERALAALENHDWPGNVRELENIIIIALATKEYGTLIELADLPPLDKIAKEKPVQENLLLFQHQFSKIPTFKEAHEAAERFAIRRALEASGGSTTKTAAALGIARDTLTSRMEKYKLAYGA